MSVAEGLFWSAVLLTIVTPLLVMYSGSARHPYDEQLRARLATLSAIAAFVLYLAAIWTGVQA